MQATGRWGGGFRTELKDDRGHSVTVDLPTDEEGTDAGTSALELNVLSLAGCITTIFALVARRRRLAFEAMTIALSADRPEGSRTIASVTGELAVTTAAAPADVETVLNLTLRTCPVGVLYEQAHVPVRVRARVLPPTAAAGSDRP